MDVLFRVTKKSAHILADVYLMKDVSTISKWKNNKVIVKSDDINKIVQFAVKESSIVQREMIREEIEVLINNSVLNDSIKVMLFEIDDFDKFIEEALNVSTSLCDNVSVFGRKSASLNGIYMGKKGFSYDVCSGNDEVNILENVDKETEGRYLGVMKFNFFLSESKKINIRVVLETQTSNLKAE